MCSLRSLRLLQVFFNPFQDPLRVSQITFPNPQPLPASQPQGTVHDPVTGFVTSKFLFPEGAMVRRLGRVLGTAMPETTVHEQREPHLPEHEIRPYFEFLLSAFRFPNFKMPPPSSDMIHAQQLRQRQFRVPIAARTNPRHDFGTFRLGKDVRHGCNSPPALLNSFCETNELRHRSEEHTSELQS